VTLIGVPANAEDIEMNVTIMRQPFFVEVSETQIKTVSSPSEGETVKFVLTVPAGSNENSVLVCGTRVPSSINSCEVEPLPSKGGGPIRVDYTYPQ
jgi:stress response protein SCP2